MNDTTNTLTNTNKKILKKLKIISINVNSIIKNQRRASLMNLINKQNPDIILLSETKLNKNHVITFTNYNVIRNDREEKNIGGGTAIIIKKSIKYEKIIIPETNEKKILEHTIIKINTRSNKKLYIIAAYARNGAQKEFIPDINRMFLTLKLDNLDNYYIIAGD